MPKSDKPYSGILPEKFIILKNNLYMLRAEIFWWHKTIGEQSTHLQSTPGGWYVLLKDRGYEHDMSS